MTSQVAEGSRQAANMAKQFQGLVITSFAAAVILLIEFGFGMWTNLYGSLPASDNGANIATGFGRAVSDGPVGLSIHAVLGIILILSALTAIYRAIAVRQAVPIILTVLGLVTVVGAAVSGSNFIGHPDNASSMSMAILTAVSIFIYVLILFLAIMVPNRPRA